MPIGYAIPELFLIIGEFYSLRLHNLPLDFFEQIYRIFRSRCFRDHYFGRGYKNVAAKIQGMHNIYRLRSRGDSNLSNNLNL